jgi:hypothetical protein
MNVMFVFGYLGCSASNGRREPHGAVGCGGSGRDAEGARQGRTREEVCLFTTIFFTKKIFISFCFKFSPPEAFFPFANGTQS